MLYRKIQIIILLLIGTVFLCSCGGPSFNKSRHEPTITYQELEASYLQNYKDGMEPMLGNDAAVYQLFREISPSADKKAAQATLNIIQKEIEHPVTGNIMNKASLYLLLGQYYESFVGNNNKALKYYQKVWRELEDTPFLHPYFDPRSRALTKEWYLLHTDAEAMFKAGDLYRKMGKKGKALKCFKRVLKMYNDQWMGAYSMDFPDTYGRVAAAKIIDLTGYKAPVTEPQRSYTGDRRTEFTKMAMTFPEDIFRGDTKKWMAYVSIGGVSTGRDRAEKRLISRDVFDYQLQNKAGPQYDMLFSWVKQGNTQMNELIPSVNYIGETYQATIQKPNDAKMLYLNFKTIDSVWYLMEMYLY